MNKLPPTFKRNIPEQFLAAGYKIFEQGSFRYLDFIRDAYAAQFSDKRGTHWAIIKKRPSTREFKTLCSCNTYMAHVSCPHIAALYFIIYSQNPDSPNIDQDTLSRYYEQSLWTSLAKLCFEHYGEDKLSIQGVVNTGGAIPEIKVVGKDKDEKNIFEFIVPEQYLARFIQQYRWRFFDQIIEQDFPFDNYNDQLEFLQAEKTDLEIRMNESDYKSWLQKFEDSFWFDFSKAWFLGFENKGYSAAYSAKSQRLEIFSEDNRFIFYIPKPQVASILIKLAQNENIRNMLNITGCAAVLNYSLEVTPKHDLKITPVLKIPGLEKPLKLTKNSKLNPVVFGKFIYLNKKGFYPFERKIKYFDSSLFKLHEISIPNDKIPKIIQEYKQFIDAGDFYKVSPSLQKKEFVQKVSAVDVFVDNIEDDWLYLSVKYRIGNNIVSLYEIYKTLSEGKRYLITENTWIDLQQVDFSWISSLLDDQSADLEFSDKSGMKLKMSKMNFIKMRAHLPIKSKINTRKNLKEMVSNLTNFKPISEAPSLVKCNYQLRDYQGNGYQWMWFLYENVLSGLLCDDMGLGKTYQSLALIDAITFSENRPLNFLVVCPTSVLPHWQDKLEQLKKKVYVHLYYGSDRKLKSLKKEKYSVVLTSYGILRNDLEQLSKINFELAVFDEIQTAKNKASLTNAALNQISSRMRIGLTGTPIENTLFELKALFDIVLPNYLCGDFNFKKNYIVPIERRENKKRLEELHHIIKPFMLRRTKNQVLLELPPKIEEVRKCKLSSDQVKMYQEVINSRAQTLIAQLYQTNENIPYIHIFAVLNYLKQICNHPAQLKNEELDYKKYQSGKWDLFCELLEESLNSGFKVVVFSHYLNMLALIDSYLQDNNIEFATIKGSTRNRKEMIERFNNDDDCKVFTGSLRASGWGIDLIGGSVVIHYDRWWNAAREDQATDRVHRIGQTRGVQVFKLVTEGTLEEKIDRLIMKKKKLMEALVREDDAKLVKHFNRDELIDLLTFDK